MTRRFAPIAVVLAALLTLNRGSLADEPFGALSDQANEGVRVSLRSKEGVHVSLHSDDPPMPPAAFEAGDAGDVGQLGCSVCGDYGICNDCEGCDGWGNERYWGSIEYLLWRTKERTLPPLVTTSPPGTPRAQAGVLSNPDTSVLFGGRVGDDVRSGGRAVLGRWLDDCQELGVGAVFFGLESDEARFSRFSTGDPILARPFRNVLLDQEDAVLVAFPGQLEGGIDARADNDLFGAEAYARLLLEEGYDYRLDLIGGYHFTRLDDRLTVNSLTTSTDPGGVAPVGTTFDIRDTFDARNEFHGGELGLMGEVQRGCWTVRALAKGSVGNMRETVVIRGSTVTSIPGAGSAQSDGGLLAQPTNSGVFTRDQTVFIPEVSLSVGYALTDQVDLTLGYSFMYWTQVVLAGDQVDLSVNPSQFGGVRLVGPAQPEFTFRDTDFWAQGLTLGVQGSF